MQSLSQRARGALFAAAFSCLALPAGAQQPGGEAPPQAVTVVTLEAQDVTLTSLLPGRVAASGVAEVRPQVNGIITERLFEEGKPVKKGDPLYRIEPSTYEAQVAAAEAQLAQANAALASAERVFARQETLLSRSVASQREVDAAISERDSAAAAVQVAKANLQSAQINLERTTVRAPLDGVSGLSQITQGALVTAGQATALTVIRNLDPVYVDVTQSAAELLRWKRNGTGAQATADQPVILHLADGTAYEHTGQLAAAEPHVNELTGVVVLRLEFPNPEEFLLPGMYVQVEVPQATISGAVLVPQEGVTRDRRGQPVAMVVTPDNKAEQRQLTIQRDHGSDWVVTDGLEAGDRVIVAGLQKIQPGMTVAPEERAEEPEAATGAATTGAEEQADEAEQAEEAGQSEQQSGAAAPEAN